MRVFGLEVQEAAYGAPGGSATYTWRPAPVQLAYADLAPQAPESVANTASHRVQPGENLTRIVHEHLRAQGGRPSPSDVYEGVSAVARDNRLDNPDLIHPGQVLDLSVLGRREQVSSSTPTSSSGAPANLETAVASAAKPVLGAPAPRRMLDSTTLLDPPGAATGASTTPPTPVDHLRPSGSAQPEGEPVPIAASAVAALMTPPASHDRVAKDATPVRESSGAAGGAGPVPSDAALALQRILNRTSNAIQVLRDMVDRDAAATPAAPNPWESLLDGKARLSSEYGTRRDPFTGRMEFHDGIDLAVKRGTGITAVREGEVVFAGWKGGHGNTVILRHDGGVETLYAHAAKLHVQAGDRVEAGMRIADSGSSGRSTGPHVHFEVREHGHAVNPMPYLDTAETMAARGGS